MLDDYIFSALKYAIVASVIYLLIRVIYLMAKKQNFALKEEIIRVVFLAYLVGLLSQTILPIWYIFTDNGFVIRIYTYNSRNLNLIPFETILGFLSGNDTIYGDVNIESRIINLFGNICLFIPYGFLSPLVLKRLSGFLKVLVSGIILSVFIEIVQYFIERSSDIDDVILNAVGVIVGFLIYKMIVKHLRRKMQRAQ